MAAWLSAFGWCVLQVTLLSVAGLALSVILRRFASSAAGACTRAALIGVLLLTGLAVAPVPSWFTSNQTPLSAHQSRAASPTPFHLPSATPPHLAHPDRIDANRDAAAAAIRELWRQSRELWGSVVPRLQTSPTAPYPEPPAAGPSPSLLPLEVACRLCLAVSALGLLRMLLAWVLVRRQVARARIVADSDVLELVNELAARLSIQLPVTIRESPDLQTAATVGWGRPVVLLPLEWTVWSPDELRAVLAHELAHIARRHFPQWIIAQAGLTLHFYHPLVHWLAARLRLEQEFEADGLASTVVGGSRGYLESLATLAVRSDGRAVPWPARPFLPTRRTLLRRIEMLRGTTIYRTASKPARLAAASTVLATGVFLAGLRAPAADDPLLPPLVVGQPAAEQSTPSTRAPRSTQDAGATLPATDDPLTPPAAPTELFPTLPKTIATAPRSHATWTIETDPKLLSRSKGPIELSWIPGDTVAVLAVRPNKLVTSLTNDKNLRGLLSIASELFESAGQRERLLQLAATAEQITAVIGLGEFSDIAKPAEFQPTTIFKFLRPDQCDAFAHELEASIPGKTELRHFADAGYKARGTTCFYHPDDLTVIMAAEPALQRLILNGPRVRSRLVSEDRFPSGTKLIEFNPPKIAPSQISAVDNVAAYDKVDPNLRGWRRVAETSHLAVAVDLEVLSRLLPTDISPIYAPFSPLWTSVERGYLGVQLVHGRLELLQLIECQNEKGAEEVGRTLEATRLLVQNTLASFRRQLPRGLIAEAAGTPQAALAGSIERLIATATMALTNLKSAIGGTGITMSTYVELEPALVLLFRDVLSAAQTTAKQDRREAHLHQLAVAFHNYAQAHGALPPAVLVEPKTGTPRSWRVELLPYLDQSDLYAKYRQDRPWDSPENRAVLEAMPDVFGDSGTATSIVAVIGPGTVFEAKRSIKLSEINDGTSNTILVLRHPSKSIPWTKPEDVEIVNAKWPVEFTDLGDLIQGDFDVALCDGSVRHVTPKPDAKSLARWLIRDDGRPVGSIFTDPAKTPSKAPRIPDERPISRPQEYKREEGTKDVFKGL